MIEVLDTSEFYTREGKYRDQVDPTWEEDNFQTGLAEECQALQRILGEAAGQTVLDCTCGRGDQVLALACLGWQVTGTDLTPASIEAAARRAEHEGRSIHFEVCDLRELGGRFPPVFDRVVSCMALDNIPDQGGLLKALQGMYTVVRPGGRVYIRLRNTEAILEDRPRYEFKEERKVPYGRVIRLDDWEYPDEEHLIHIVVFLREDSRHPDYWDTDTFAYRRCVLRQSALARMMEQVGFRDVMSLPTPGPWHPCEVVGRKLLAADQE